MSQKVATFKLSVTLSNVNRFSKFLHCWKAYEIWYKTHHNRPPHLRHVSTITWEIKNSNFCRYSPYMEENASILHSPLTLLFVHKFWYFRCSKNGLSFPIRIAKIFLCHCSFGYLLLRSICGIKNSSQQMSLQCLSTINMVFSVEDKILLRSLYFEGYTAKRSIDEFPEKRWTKRGVSKLLQGLIRRWDTRTWRVVSSYLFTYLPLKYDTTVVPEYFSK